MTFNLWQALSATLVIVGSIGLIFMALYCADKVFGDPYIYDNLEDDE
jgi:hypothetical protein